MNLWILCENVTITDHIENCIVQLMKLILRHFETLALQIDNNNKDVYFCYIALHHSNEIRILNRYRNDKFTGQIHPKSFFSFCSLLTFRVSDSSELLWTPTLQPLTRIYLCTLLSARSWDFSIFCRRIRLLGLGPIYKKYICNSPHRTLWTRRYVQKTFFENGVVRENDGVSQG